MSREEEESERGVEGKAESNPGCGHGGCGEVEQAVYGAPCGPPNGSSLGFDAVGAPSCSVQDPEAETDAGGDPSMVCVNGSGPSPGGIGNGGAQGDAAQQKG